jgi:hypothetical protein
LDPDPHLIAAWIRIRIPNADPDPGGLKRALEGENAPKRQIIRQDKDKIKSNLICIKWVNVTLFSLKVNF